MITEQAEHAENVRGATWMTIATAGYVTNDAFVKLVAEDTPLFQAIFFRGLLISIGLFLYARHTGALADATRSAARAVVPRTVFEMAGTVAYLTALTHMDIANVTAVMQIVPLLVTLAAARLLRERVRPHRTISVLIGFLGVMIIVRPGTDGFNAWSLLALVAVVAVVARELATRHLSDEIPSLVVALATAISITVMAAVLSIFEGWGPLTSRMILLLAAASAFLCIGYVGSIITIRTGDVSFTAAFRYTLSVFAIILQIVLFRDVPDLTTWIGTGLIIGAGLFAYYREQTLADRDQTPAESSSAQSGIILDG